jgi:hypothetical protein
VGPSEARSTVRDVEVLTNRALAEIKDDFAEVKSPRLRILSASGSGGKDVVGDDDAVSGALPPAPC